MSGGIASCEGTTRVRGVGGVALIVEAPKGAAAILVYSR